MPCDINSMLLERADFRVACPDRPSMLLRLNSHPQSPLVMVFSAASWLVAVREVLHLHSKVSSRASRVSLRARNSRSNPSRVMLLLKNSHWDLSTR